MDTSLLLLLIAGLGYAALLYYLLFVRSERDPAGWGLSGIMAMLFIIAPIIVIVLWSQSGAQQRLHDLGFVPHPKFVSSMGIATGVGESPTWVFDTDATEAEIVAFYKREEHRPGWQLTGQGPSVLVFKNARRTLTLFTGDGSAVFVLDRDHESKP